MGLNDRLKGSYYKNYETTLASRTSIYNTINELKSYYTNLVELITTTNDKISDYRTDMKAKLNSIILKLNVIEYNLDNFQLEIDSSLEEKMKKLMENYDTDFVEFVNSFDINLYNHTNLEDSYSTGSDTNEQSTDEYEKSIEKLNTKLGIRWFGGKFNDRLLLNKLKSMLHIVKLNKYEGINQEDYINSNLILDIFLYSSKGITWLTLGRNATFGYNIKVKYNSLKNTNLNIKINSENYYNPKSYELNEFDLNLLLDLGYTEEDIIDGNVYFKIKTNIPSNTYSGLDEYYLNGCDNINEYNSKRVIKNIGERHIDYNNKDHAYNMDEITDLESFREKNKINDKKTEYIQDFVDENNDKSNTYSDNDFSLYTDINIEASSDNTKTEIITTIKRSNDNKEVIGLNDNVGAITVDNSENNVDSENTLVSDINDNKIDENENILYNENKNRINLLDHRDVGNNIGLITENENTFVINNELDDNNEVVVNGKDLSLKNDTNPSLKNEVVNNELLDINTNGDFVEDPIKISESGNSSFTPNKTTKKETLINEEMMLINNQNLFVIKGVENEKIIQLIEGVTKVNDFIQLMDGSIYIFTDNGIYKTTSETNYNIETTNIISGKFTTVSYTDDSKTSFYTVSTSGSIVENTSEDDYKLINFIYIYDINTTNIKDLNDYFNEYNLDNSSIRSSDKDLLNEIIKGDNGYKLFKFDEGNKWILFNRSSCTTFVSTTNKLGNFSKKDIIVSDYVENKYGLGNNRNLFYQSNITSGYFYCLTTIGNTVIAGSYSDKGLYYSNDNGITWIQSNITSGSFNCLTTIGNTVIAGSDNKGLYYSNDNGIFGSVKLIKEKNNLYLLEANYDRTNDFIYANLYTVDTSTHSFDFVSNIIIPSSISNISVDTLSQYINYKKVDEEFGLIDFNNQIFIKAFDRVFMIDSLKLTFTTSDAQQFNNQVLYDIRLTIDDKTSWNNLNFKTSNSNIDKFVIKETGIIDLDSYEYNSDTKKLELIDVNKNIINQFFLPHQYYPKDNNITSSYIHQYKEYVSNDYLCGHLKHIYNPTKDILLNNSRYMNKNNDNLIDITGIQTNELLGNIEKYIKNLNSYKIDLNIYPTNVENMINNENKDPDLVNM